MREQNGGRHALWLAERAAMRSSDSWCKKPSADGTKMRWCVRVCVCLCVWCTVTQCFHFVFGAVIAAEHITFILLRRVLKALFRSGVFSDGETACHCRGKFRLSVQPTDNMLGWGRGQAGVAGLGWVATKGVQWKNCRQLGGKWRGGTAQDCTIYSCIRSKSLICMMASNHVIVRVPV